MSDLKILTDGWDQLRHSPLWLILALVTLCIGLTLKSIKIFPNQLIPLITLPFATFAYAFMGNPGEIDFNVPYPRVMLGFYGLIDGFITWGTHKLVLRRLEKYLPWLTPVISEFDSAPPVALPDGSNVRKDLPESANAPKTGI